MKSIFAIALPLYALDQITKWWVFTHFALVPSEQNIRLFPNVVQRTASLPETRVVVPGFFQIVHWANTGAAFSVGTGRNVFFIALSIATLAILLTLLLCGKLSHVCGWSRIGIALLLAGILGNLTDRIAHHYVVDFLLFDLHVRFADPWPAFNVADSCICIAVAIFLARSIFEKSPREKSTA